jgi:hypothetical protein
MKPAQTIAALLAGASRAATEALRAGDRQAARLAWARQAVAALKAAEKRADEAWDRIFAALPDDLDDEELDKIPEPPEQAEADRLWEEIEAVIEKDRWPKHLYWSL